MRRKHLSWLLLAILSLPFVWGAARVRVLNSLEGWFVEGDAALVEYRAFLREFGNDEIIVVALEQDAPPGFEAGLRSLPAVRLVRPQSVRLFQICPALFPDDAARDALLDGIRELIRTQGVAAHMAGIGVVYQAVNRASHDDLERMLLPAAVVCALILLGGVRRIGALLVALAAMGVSAVWALGLFGLADVPVNLVTTMVPTVVAVLGLANTLHLVRPREPGAPVLRACLFSALTSAAAFLALTISDVRMLRELGLFAAAGILGSFVVAALITAPLEPTDGRSRLGLRLERLGDWVLRHRLPVTALLVLLACFAVLGQTRLRVDTNLLAFLPDSHPVRRDSDWIEKNVGFYVPLVLRSNRPATEQLLRELEQPDDLDGAETIGSFIVVNTPMRSALAVEGSIDRACAIVRRSLGPATDVHAVGYMPVYIRLTEYLGRSFVKSMPLAIALNFGLLVILLRSLRWALLGTLPNLLPVALLLGVMGWIGMRLDIAAISIACVAFGIVVDDTIHLLVHARASVAAGESPAAAVRSTLRTGGSAIFWTTMVLSGGFATFVAARVVPVRLFGTLLAATLLAGLVCDLLLFPLLLTVSSRTRHRKRSP